MPHPTHQRNHERCNRPAYPNCPKPVVLLPLVQHNLQAACPHHQQAKADVVERTDFCVLDVRRIVNEAAHHVQRQEAERNVDVKRVPPTEGIGQPAA